MRYWEIILKLQCAITPLWSIVEQIELKNEFLMVILVKYIIMKKIKITVQRPLKHDFHINPVLNLMSIHKYRINK